MTALQKMKQENNVVNIDSKSFQYALRLFLSDLRSENTYKTYLSCYRDFFNFATGKELDEIEWNDVLAIQYDDMLMYKQYLKKKRKFTNNTINQKIRALKSLWIGLKRINNDIDINVVSIKPYKNTTINGSDGLTEQEAIQLLEYAKSRPWKGYVQYMFFKIAIVTALRKSSLLNLKWKDIKQLKDKQSNELYWCIVVHDKTGTKPRPIRDDVYRELLELKDLRYTDGMRINDDRVFKISEDKLVETLRDFCKEYGINRKITLHSLRKTSADLANSLCDHDIKKIQHQTGHKNAQILVETYQGTNYSFKDYPGLMMFQDNIDVNRLYDYSKEQLIEIIKKCSDSTIREILSKLN